MSLRLACQLANKVVAAAPVALWNQLNGCPSTGTLRTIDAVADGTSINSTVYAGCTGGAENRFDDVIGGGYTWSGGAQYLSEALIAKTSGDMNASLERWRFVSCFSF